MVLLKKHKLKSPPHCQYKQVPDKSVLEFIESKIRSTLYTNSYYRFSFLKLLSFRFRDIESFGNNFDIPISR